MSDFIDRQAVFDALIEKGQNSKRYKLDENWELNLPEIIEAINVIPLAELERKKGRWQRRKGSDCWECSECHAVLENDDLGMHNFYFCYHCGTNMMNKNGYMDIEEVHYE